VELAKRAAGAGVDGLNLLNSDMGGQTGKYSASSFVGDALKLDLDIPLLCAGGIGDEIDFTAALDMGYSAVQMGTRFIATHECKVTKAYKNGIVKASKEDIVLTNKLAGTESYVILTPTIEKGGLRVNAVVSFFLRQPATKSLARMFLLTKAVDGYKKAAFDDSYEVWQAGKGVSSIKSVESVEAIMDRFKSSYENRTK
jgi:nitronate monooxygenase